MANKYVTTDTNLVELLTQLKADMEILRIKKQPDDRPALIREIENIIKKYEEISSNRQTPGYEKRIFNTTKEIDKNAAVQNYRIQVNDLIGEIKNSETYKGLGEKLTRLQELDAKAKAEAEEAVKGRAATGIQKVVRGHQARTNLKKEQEAATTIQRVVRGKLARNVRAKLKEEKATREQAESAAREQEVLSDVSERDEPEVTRDSSVSTASKATREQEALSTIQRVFRGKLTRNVRAKLKEEKATREQAESAAKEQAALSDVSERDEPEVTRDSSVSTASTASTVVASHVSERDKAEVTRDSSLSKASTAPELIEKYLDKSFQHKNSTFYKNLGQKLSAEENNHLKRPLDQAKGYKGAEQTEIYNAMKAVSKNNNLWSPIDKTAKNEILNEIADKFQQAPNQESRKQLLELFILTAGTHRNPTRFGLFNKPGSETSTIQAFKKAIENIYECDLKTLVEEKLGLTHKGPSLEN